jgi:transaldolase
MWWSEFIGGEVIVSIPHSWWKRFNASSIKVKDSIGNPIDPAIVKTLEMNFEDFRRAYEQEGYGSRRIPAVRCNSAHAETVYRLLS